jgi:hypothetical protein
MIAAGVPVPDVIQKAVAVLKGKEKVPDWEDGGN